MRGIHAFDDADDALTYMPMAARRALDVAGRKVSLQGWQAMTLEDKTALVELGAADAIDVAKVRALLPGAPAIDPVTTFARPADISDAEWSRLSPLGRYCVVKCENKPDKRARVLRELLPRG